MGELDKTKLMDNYVTFLAGILRSVRFGAADAHAKANMVRFNFFAQEGAVTRDAQTGRYRVDVNTMTRAIDALSARLLTIDRKRVVSGKRVYGRVHLGGGCHS